MVQVHRCSLPQREAPGLKQLPPNASWRMRVLRRIRKLTIVNPMNFKCKIFFNNRSTILAEQKRHISSPHYYIVHPYSTLSSVYEVIFFVIWTTKMLGDPVIENGRPVSFWVEHINDFVFPVIQYLLIICLFFVGYIDVEAAEVVIEHRRVIGKYLKTYFIFDIMAVDSFSFIFDGPMFEVPFSWRISKVLYYTHVLCLYVRLGTILDYLDNILKMLQVTRKIRKCFTFCVRTYMYLHLFSCMTYFVPKIVYHKNWPGDSWLVHANIHPASKPPMPMLYRECLLMTMCYFFGTSEGKYYVNQTCEQICFCFITFFGRLYTLFLLANVLRMFGVAGVSESNYERSFVQLKEFMKANDLPPNLRNRMVRYYEHKLQKRFFNESEILDSLSDNLRNELFLYSARLLIKKCPIFRYLPERDTAALISLMRTDTFAPGNVLFKPGQYLEDIYMISTGTVTITNREGLELCHLEDGDTFGFISRLAGWDNYSAIVLETTELFTIKFDDLEEFLRPFPEARGYLREMVNERLEDYKKLETAAAMDLKDCLVELRTGRLLERRKIRTTVAAE